MRAPTDSLRSPAYVVEEVHHPVALEDAAGILELHLVGAGAEEGPPPAEHDRHPARPRRRLPRSTPPRWPRPPGPTRPTDPADPAASWRRAGPRRACRRWPRRW